MTEKTNNKEFEIENKYIIKKQIGEGMFGKVFLAKHKYTDDDVAIKLDSSILLKNEARIYKLLSSIEGIPKLRAYGIIEHYNYMVIDRLGESLEQLKENCGGKLDLYTTITLGLQILQRVEDIHKKNIIHRDIKPENLLMNVGNNNKKILYIIDFGLSKLYKITGNHLKCEKGRSIVGTLRFVSLNIHKGYTPSRRDDLESVGYTLLYLLYGSLPWVDTTGETEIYDKKSSFSLWDLNDIPGEIITFICYCRGLRYEEDPDYTYLRELLRNLFKMKKYKVGDKLCWD